VNTILAAEIRNLGGDPSDEVWRWFILNGPHGPEFSWGQSRVEPAGYVGIEHLERIVAERTTNNPEFPARVRAVIQQSFTSTHRGFLRRAIQVAAVVGDAAELERLMAFANHINDKVAADARASAFYLKKKIRAR
jgi:hypothetical protein